MVSSKPSSSSSEPTIRWTHDVFLSFRGEDTRNNFVDHLYSALVQKGIQTFKDDEVLQVGTTISHELRKAIEESRSSVVVFSENYAMSSWCLDELAEIMECWDQLGQKVIPVFYHVDPSDVRKQSRSFATAFQEHERKCKGEIDKVNKWREASTAAATLSGYHISADSGGEAAFIDKIVQGILGNMPPRGRERNIIGIESHMDALNSLLEIEATQEVRIVGIFGMGGIGKTTIAQALFKRIAYNFEGSSFVNDVRENSSTRTHICAIQEKILTDILVAHHGFKIQDPEYGADMIQERLFTKKVLLVLDDVDDVKQLEFLAATHDWFGPGSRIIITTRDMHLLSDANAKYKPALLRMDQAVVLFCKHAFRKNSPPDVYKDLSDRAIRYTGRLPLALKVLGSFFRGRQASVWESALDRLAKIPNSEIFEKLKLSFDDLNILEQNIFLDIACFFKGRKVEYVTLMLDSFGFDAMIGINVLIEKSLITVSEQRLGMHDLIQEMGRKIVPYGFQNSRLWQVEKIHDYIDKKMKLKFIEAIVLPWNYGIDEQENLKANSDVFESMKNLRLLDVYQEFTSTEPTCLPDELRWLRWYKYPYSSLPAGENSKLVGLEMKGSANIEHLWKGKKIMPNLKFIHLKNLESLTRFPDVSGAQNIETLIISNCEELMEVDDSVGFLKRLVYMKMKDCGKLKCFPSRFEMESLETLIFDDCSLERLPEFSPCMVKLSHLSLDLCDIEQVPSSIRYLSKLSYLNLSVCLRLEKIPNSLCELTCLKSLCLSSCSTLLKLPDDFGSMRNIENLRLQGSINLRDLTNFCLLKTLDLSGNQIGEQEFPETRHGFSTLEELSLSKNSKLIQLPRSIYHLSTLKELNLDYCYQLENIHGLPSGIQVLTANYCKSLKKIDDLSQEYKWLHKIWLVDCKKLLEDQENEKYLENMLTQSFLKKYAALDCGLTVSIPGSKIPSWFKEQQHGDTIALKLHPKWKTQIMGFAICGIFGDIVPHYYPQIKFTFENNGRFVPMAEIDCNNNVSVTTGKKGSNMLTGYIPLSLFKQMNDDDDYEFQGEGLSHITEGNLVITIANIIGSRDVVVRCGAYIVYKEHVETIKQIKPAASIPSYYWSWKLSHIKHNSTWCS